MKRRNCYFAKYTKMVNIEPAAGKAKPISNTTSQDAIDSRFSRLWSEGGNGTGSNTCRASVPFQDSKSADQRPPIKDTIHPSLHSVFSIGSPIDPESPCRGLRRSVGGYAREPEARSTIRERFRLPPAYGRYRGRAYKARALLLIAYLLRQALYRSTFVSEATLCSKKGIRWVPKIEVELRSP
jgi:hypothetical protein